MVTHFWDGTKECLMTIAADRERFGLATLDPDGEIVAGSYGTWKLSLHGGLGRGGARRQHTGRHRLGHRLGDSPVPGPPPARTI